MLIEAVDLRKEFKIEPVPTKKNWCLGRDIPVEIHVFDSTGFRRLTDGRILPDSRIGEIRFGTVTALDPREIKAGRPQGKGLFLDGPVAREGSRIKRVITVAHGTDVTRFVNMSYGSAL